MMETQLVRQLIMKVSSGDICSPSWQFYYRFLNIVRFNELKRYHIYMYIYIYIHIYIYILYYIILYIYIYIIYDI